MTRPASNPPVGSSKWNYFVVLVDYGKIGRSANVDPETTWRGALDLVREAAGDGNSVLFVHEIRDGQVEDRTEEAFSAVMNAMASCGDALSRNQYEFIEQHVSMEAARSFRLEDA